MPKMLMLVAMVMVVVVLVMRGTLMVMLGDDGGVLALAHFSIARARIPHARPGVTACKAAFINSSFDQL